MNIRLNIIWLFILVINVLCYSFDPVLLRYAKEENSRIYYKLSVENNIKSQEKAYVYMMIDSVKNSKGVIDWTIQYFFQTAGKKIGPFFQNEQFNILGNVKVDDVIDIKDSSNYIDVTNFFVTFPKHTVNTGLEWSEQLFFLTPESKLEKFKVKNIIKKIDLKLNLCYIISIGSNENKDFLFRRQIIFDYKKGQINKGELKYLIRKKEKSIKATIKLEKTEK